ncbi:hypothetical protein HAX54_012734 [Datura stramonium]|uniref:Uncharacterized protein n=1 Tax=Datura stramonium TaxID=4076 RepID=A0ABS8Y5L4_DATST|nr:hypothetical protein [Datura stramonium]
MTGDGISHPNSLKPTRCTETTKLKAFLFPWLAYGHISPFLELTRKLADRGFLVDVCSSPINVSFIRTRIPESYCSSILVELQLPDSSELPPHYHITNVSHSISIPPFKKPSKWSNQISSTY